MVYSPLAQGLLTGKYTSVSDIPENSRAAKLGWDEGKINADKIAKVNRLIEVANKLEIKVGQLALAWILRQSNVSSALVGASRPEQVKENAAASGIKLDAEIIGEIERILA